MGPCCTSDLYGWYAMEPPKDKTVGFLSLLQISVLRETVEICSSTVIGMLEVADHLENPVLITKLVWRLGNLCSHTVYVFTYNNIQIEG